MLWPGSSINAFCFELYLLEGNQPFQTNVYLFAIKWILLLVHFLSYYLWGFFIWQTFLFHINGKWVLNLLQAFFGLLIRFIMVWKIVLIALIRDLFWYKKKKSKFSPALRQPSLLRDLGWNSELAFLFRCTCLWTRCLFLLHFMLHQNGNRRITSQ